MASETEAAGNGAPAAEGEASGNGMSQEALMAEVKRLKAILDASSSKSKEEVIAALDQLTTMGSLPTKVIHETQVGKAVNSVSKAAADEDVKSKAKQLVDSWRQTHRKRKASSGDLTRSLSSAPSLDSEAASPRAGSQPDFESQAASPVASQETNPAPVTAPEAPEAPALERASSTVSLSSQAGDGKKEDGYRDKVRAKLVEALGKEEEIEAKGGESEQAREGMQDPVILAAAIEEELNKALPKKEAYMNQARSILFNLKDAKNPTFRFKIMVGFFSPDQLPTVTAEDMASDEKNQERAKQRKFAMEALDQGWALKNGQQQITGMFTCGKCKGTKTTYFQMQTRSSDEPMTTFVTCLTCNNRWKFC